MTDQKFHEFADIGTALYETRFGGLTENRQPEMSRFSDAVQDIFITTEKLFYLPVKLNRIVFPKLQKLHEKSWEIIYSTSKYCFDCCSAVWIFLRKGLLDRHSKFVQTDSCKGWLSHLGCVVV